jgi:hypothetical protein
MLTHKRIPLEKTERGLLIIHNLNKLIHKNIANLVLLDCGQHQLSVLKSIRYNPLAEGTVQ